ncbi:MAG: hypothetical protein ACLFWL_06980 [Candidatus Brocadiia bacterium]
MSTWGGRQHLIQVCYELPPDNRERELDGIVTAARRLGLQEGRILTHQQAETLVFDEITVHITPVFRWALQREQ